jgi:hypothetical protein
MLNYKQLTLITISLIFSTQAFAQESQSTTTTVETPQHSPSAPTEPAKTVEQPIPTTAPTEPAKPVTPPTPAPVEPEKTAVQPAPAAAIAPESKPTKPATPAKKSKPQPKKKATAKNQVKVAEYWDRDCDNSQFVTPCDEEQTLGYMRSSDKAHISESEANESESISPATQEAPDLTHIDQAPFSFPILNKIHEWHRSHLDKPSPFLLVFAEGDVDLNEDYEAPMANILHEVMSRPGAVVRIKSFGYVNSDNPTDSRRAALQRAIKVRKFLIENDINPTNISVNAVEDMNGRKQ